MHRSAHSALVDHTGARIMAYSNHRPTNAKIFSIHWPDPRYRRALACAGTGGSVDADARNRAFRVLQEGIQKAADNAYASRSARVSTSHLGFWLKFCTMAEVDPDRFGILPASTPQSEIALSVFVNCKTRSSPLGNGLLASSAAVLYLIGLKFRRTEPNALVM